MFQLTEKLVGKKGTSQKIGGGGGEKEKRKQKGSNCKLYRRDLRKKKFHGSNEEYRNSSQGKGVWRGTRGGRKKIERQGPEIRQERHKDQKSREFRKTKLKITGKNLGHHMDGGQKRGEHSCMEVWKQLNRRSGGKNKSNIKFKRGKYQASFVW